MVVSSPIYEYDNEDNISLEFLIS